MLPRLGKHSRIVRSSKAGLAVQLGARPIVVFDDPWKLAAQLLYGSGLRIKDIDFGHGTITIHDAQGGKHPLVPLPKALEPHLSTPREKHRQDLIAGVDEVHMPESLARKYPNTPREWLWQFVFPAAKSLLGHSSVETTMVSLHLLDRPGAGAPSPLDV